MWLKERYSKEKIDKAIKGKVAWGNHFKKAIGRFLKGADIASEKFPTSPDSTTTETSGDDHAAAADDGRAGDDAISNCTGDKSTDNPPMEEITEEDDITVIE